MLKFVLGFGVGTLVVYKAAYMFGGYQVMREFTPLLAESYPDDENIQAMFQHTQAADASLAEMRQSLKHLRGIPRRAREQIEFEKIVRFNKDN